MEQQLMTWERKILRKIYGPKYENGYWRIRYNTELKTQYKSPDIVAEIKARFGVTFDSELLCNMMESASHGVLFVNGVIPILCNNALDDTPESIFKGCEVRAARYLEKKKEVYVVFVELEKAFDRVDWNKLMGILKKIDVDWKERCLIDVYILRWKKSILASGREKVCENIQRFESAYRFHVKGSEKMESVYIFDYLQEDSNNESLSYQSIVLWSEQGSEISYKADLHKRRSSSAAAPSEHESRIMPRRKALWKPVTMRCGVSSKAAQKRYDTVDELKNAV
ncbi:hypothetical protein ANN_23537 [Periplaneta americana]|uniref:Reverse transcriptase domain-containing protein n=1 Tax=Periplaneta americana TaxID=6978 RepID=A0ABQ8SLD8_PERAM|nr:hypothetical protein ANN_23537 [Periplaneta americana]